MHLWLQQTTKILVNDKIVSFVSFRNSTAWKQAQADGKVPFISVSCVIGVLGGSLSGCRSGSSPVWVPVLSRSTEEEEEETLLWRLHQDRLCYCQTASGLGHGAGASLHCHGPRQSRGEGARAGERGVRGGFVLRMTEGEQWSCWSRLQTDLLW